LHHRKEGCPSDQENIAKHPISARTGWFSDREHKEHHPYSWCGQFSRIDFFDLIIIIRAVGASTGRSRIVLPVNLKTPTGANGEGLFVAATGISSPPLEA
jgi:hypothetical protein